MATHDRERVAWRVERDDAGRCRGPISPGDHGRETSRRCQRIVIGEDSHHLIERLAYYSLDGLAPGVQRCIGNRARHVNPNSATPCVLDRDRQNKLAIGRVGMAAGHSKQAWRGTGGGDCPRRGCRSVAPTDLGGVVARLFRTTGVGKGRHHGREWHSGGGIHRHSRAG